jgi:hypothetical protein
VREPFDLARIESDGLPIIRPWNPAGKEFEGLPARLPSGAIVKIRVLAPRGFNFYGREFEEGECFYSTYSVMRTIQHCYEGEEGEKREVGESINARGRCRLGWKSAGWMRSLKSLISLARSC